VISEKLKALFEDDDMGLLNVPIKSKPQTSSDRLEASFLEIIDFYNENGREPDSRSSDLGERKLGVRLHGIRADEQKREALKHLDDHQLLAIHAPATIAEVFSDDYGLLDDPTGILTLKNVSNPVKTSEYIARQRPCKDFDKFKPFFLDTHEKIRNGELRMKPFTTEQQIAKGEFFVLRGQVVYVAERGTDYRKHGKRDARLRVIYENGTESDLLSRALARGLYRGGSRIVGAVDLFADEREKINSEDEKSGYIYIISSLSNEPKISNIANLYKIGYSTGPVEQRIKNAVNDPTYLMAPIKIEATYRAYNMNIQKFEQIVHRLFANAKLNVTMVDKSGAEYTPTEWFVVPIDVIDDTVKLIINGEITQYYYDNDHGELSLIESRKPD